MERDNNLCPRIGIMNRQCGYLRIWQIIGDRRRGIPPLIPISKTTWWHRCRTDPTWPQPVKLTERCTAWKEADVMALLKRLEESDNV